jgi:hypothetical protein
MIAFYSRDAEGRYVASEHTVGPWDPKLQHGGPVAALLASRIEQAAALPDSRVAQFSLEFLSPVAKAALEVSLEQQRPGKRISLWSARAKVDGREQARVSVWMLNAKEGRNPLVHLEDEKPPPMPAQPISTYFKEVPRFGYGDSIEWRFPEGGFEQLGPATCWARLKGVVVEGEPVTPLQRILAMVDSANGISAELDVAKFLFVPVNLNVSLTRYPAGEWTGMRAVTSISSDGIGTTRARLFDQRGEIGRALQTLYVDRR